MYGKNRFTLLKFLLAWEIQDLYWPSSKYNLIPNYPNRTPAIGELCSFIHLFERELCV